LPMVLGLVRILQHEQAHHVLRFGRIDDELSARFEYRNYRFPFSLFPFPLSS
jgi:hypothetical protein